MELFDKLPNDLHWTVIKYLQHPLTMILKKQIKVGKVFREQICLNFKVNYGQPCRFMFVKLVEYVEKSKELDHKIKFPTHPIADLLRKEIIRIIVDDEFIDEESEDYGQILEYILWVKRDRIHKARPSYKIHELINWELRGWYSANKDIMREHKRGDKHRELSSFPDFYFKSYNSE